ncbi:P-loop containing nucleoside triphosphate hydrolase protein [Chlamydoabsidia padenii]|nr:P-loop containing nucleoside triphosphate hydrolase protein [Chlamydoabsidia padenii]
MSSSNAWGQNHSEQDQQQEGLRWQAEYKRTGGGVRNRGWGKGGAPRQPHGGFHSQTRTNQQAGWGQQQDQNASSKSSDTAGWDVASTTKASINDGWSKPKTSSTANDGWSTPKASNTTNDGWSTPKANNTTNDGWSTPSASNTTNGGWSTAAKANTKKTGWAESQTKTSGDGWFTPAQTSQGSWANTAASTPAIKTNDSWASSPTTASNKSWDTPTTGTTDTTQTDSWSSGMTFTQTEWNPSGVSWLKTMDEPEKKESGRGEWKDGQHIIAERDIEIEKKLFGETDADFVHSGINFEKYDNIPIKVEDDTLFEPMEAFTSPPLDSHLLSNIKMAQYSTPTPVQKYSVPIVTSGRDLMACAQTGSGKTAGFLFPVLSRLFNEGPQKIVQKKNKDGTTRDSRKAYPEVLILAPTRELASQIYKETKKFCYRSFVRPCVAYGGADIAQQLRLLGRGCSVLVATPGRLVDILERRRLSLCNIRYLVLDEADRMLDMGFEPQIRRIVQGEDMPEPSGRQTLMFSATFPKSIQGLAKEFMNNYVFFTVGKVGGASENIKQEIIYVEDKDKRQQLLDILQQEEQVDGLTLIFVETKRLADSLCEYLVGHGKKATSIHGDRLQREREEALQAFRSGQVPILVATAVAARGLDIPNVTHVISFDVPKDIDDYTHRIGRTARAGNTGRATALFERRNRYIAPDLVALLKEAKQVVPGWLQDMADEPLPPMNNDPPRRRRNNDADDGIGIRIKNLKF